MFRPGRSPLCTLLIAFVFVATTSIASGFMPPQVAAADQPIIAEQVQNGAIAQAFTGTTLRPAAKATKYGRTSPKDRRKAAAYGFTATKTPPLRKVTNRTRHLSLLLPSLQEPPKPKPIHSQELGSLIDFDGMLQRLDNVVDVYRNNGKIAALRSAIDQRVRTAMRIAELDAAARQNAPDPTRFAQRQADKPRRVRIAQTQTQTPIATRGGIDRDALGDIDRKIAQLRSRREEIDRQIAQLDRQRIALAEGMPSTLHTRRIAAGAYESIPAAGTSADAQRLIDAVAQTDAMLQRTELSPAERRAIRQRRTELAERLTAIVVQSCRIPTRNEIEGNVNSAGDSTGIITELRSTIRELRLDVARVSDELLQAQRGLVDRFDEIERRTNVIEAEIRSSLQRRVLSNEQPQRSDGEHAALGSSDL